MAKEWDEQLFRDAMNALAAACGWLPYAWDDSHECPIEKKIDDACGFKPLTGEMTPERRALIMVGLRCPKCKKEQDCARSEDDPENCALVEIICPECFDGDDVQTVVYFDASGQEIDCDGNAIGSKLNNEAEANKLLFIEPSKD